MSPTRRRTRSGISLGIIIAVLTAIFTSRANTRANSTAVAVGTDAQRTTTSATAGTRGETRSTDATEARRTNSPGFASRQRLVEHYDKHGNEFPGLSMAAYLAAAQTLRDAAAGGDVLEVRRRDGVITRFDKGSGAFLATNRDGTIRTFFKPNDGEAYFRRQASRTPGGGP